MLRLSLTRIVFDGRFGSDLPHPEVEWDRFLSAVRVAAADVGMVCDPLKLTLKPWVRLNKLVRDYRYLAIKSSSHVRVGCAIM
jgi:hypothetical protein